MIGRKKFGIPMIELENKIIQMVSNNLVTVVAPGSKFKNLVSKLNVLEIYDFDPYLDYDNYIQKDIVLDDVKLKTDYIITCHGELIYPLIEIYSNKKHLFCINTNYFYTYCTTEKIMDEYNIKKIRYNNIILYYNFNI